MHKSESERFLDNHPILEGALVTAACIGGVGGMTVGIVVGAEAMVSDIPPGPCDNLEVVDYEAEIASLPEKLIVQENGMIADQNGDINIGSAQLHFPGLSSLRESRIAIQQSTNLSELREASALAFEPLGISVLFGDVEYPYSVADTHANFSDLLLNDDYTEMAKVDIDQLLIDETFRPFEYQKLSDRESVSIVAGWHAAGTAHSQVDRAEDERIHRTDYVKLIAWDRGTNSYVNAHEAGHNFDSSTCGWRSTNSIYDNNPENNKSNRTIEIYGQEYHNPTSFISSYGATGGATEELAEGIGILYRTGIPTPQGEDEPTNVDLKLRSIAQQHEAIMPGSLQYFTAMGAGMLCFDINLDAELYPDTNNQIPQQALTC